MADVAHSVNPISSLIHLTHLKVRMDVSFFRYDYLQQAYLSLEQ